MPSDGSGWGSLMMNGRLVSVTCPDCLTDAERAQVEARDGAYLYEVAPGRRAEPDVVAVLAGTARQQGRQAPARDWTGDLAGPAVGVVVSEPEEGWLRALFAAPGRAGRHRMALLEIETAHWLELEEVLVPSWVRERARQLNPAPRTP